MKHENILQLTGNEVRTQYGDLTGMIQIDCHNNVVALYDLCKDYNFNMSNYFIIGFGFSDFSIKGIGEFGTISCSVYMVKKSDYGNDFDTIQNTISHNEVNVLKKSFDVPVANIGKYIKRVDAMLLTEMGKSISSMSIENTD